MQSLAIGGSYQVNEFDPTSSSHYGDVSACINAKSSALAEFIRRLVLEVALLGNWKRRLQNCE